jgi:uncharacterized protein
MSYKIYNRSNGHQLAVCAVKRKSLIRRMLGLISTPELATGSGMILEPCRSVHTCGMRYAIDVAFISRNHMILHMIHSMKPYRMSRIVWGAVAVIELPAGVLHKTSTINGHLVDIQ